MKEKNTDKRTVFFFILEAYLKRYLSDSGNEKNIHSNTAGHCHYYRFECLLLSEYLPFTSKLSKKFPFKTNPD
ncbi:MAG: hypothetical protein J7K46_10710, partial [Bacteroidales bacterium]|nr:hypothetical protein [Bacteroidales bacterium]